MNQEQTVWIEEMESGWKSADLPFLALEDTFVSGDPSGHRFTVRYFCREDDNALMAKIVFGRGTQGPPGHAHGGSMAAVLDEAMGGAAWMQGHPVLAAQLNITFRNMLPLESSCIIEAVITSVEGRKVKTTSTLHNVAGDVVYAEGEALFIILDEKKIGMLSDQATGIIERMKKLNKDS
jgi:acyl-coenzyme A thioesterase PaaI-like protein